HGAAVDMSCAVASGYFELDPILMRNEPSSRRSRYAPWQLAHCWPSGAADALASSHLPVDAADRMASACFFASVAKPTASVLPFVFQNASVCVKAFDRIVAWSFAAAASILSIAPRSAVFAGPTWSITFWNASSSGVIGGGSTFATSTPVELT